jgi:ribonuclease BN (tRNA processing enzyme)
LFLRGSLGYGGLDVYLGENMIRVKFLGVGDASQQGLGHASIVLETLYGSPGAQRMLVDCGPGVIDSFIAEYDCLPDAVFITHCHLDHIADFEKLFIKSWFHKPKQHRPKIFVPITIVELLHSRVGSYPEALAEGGVNFWDAFQLIPVQDSFQFHDLCYQIFPARHHGLNSAYSLYLNDCFFYSGDTRPVPEVIEHKLDEKCTIFHDCSVLGNPSHTGIDDLIREYTPKTLQRLYAYHYHDASEGPRFIERGIKIVEPMSTFEFLLPKKYQ